MSKFIRIDYIDRRNFSNLKGVINQLDNLVVDMDDYQLDFSEILKLLENAKLNGSEGDNILNGQVIKDNSKETIIKLKTPMSIYYVLSEDGFPVKDVVIVMESISSFNMTKLLSLELPIEKYVRITYKNKSVPFIQTEDELILTKDIDGMDSVNVNGETLPVTKEPSDYARVKLNSSDQKLEEIINVTAEINGEIINFYRLNESANGTISRYLIDNEECRIALNTSLINDSIEAVFVNGTLTEFTREDDVLTISTQGFTKDDEIYVLTENSLASLAISGKINCYYINRRGIYFYSNEPLSKVEINDQFYELTLANSKSNPLDMNRTESKDGKDGSGIPSYVYTLVFNDECDINNILVESEAQESWPCKSIVLPEYECTFDDHTSLLTILTGEDNIVLTKLYYNYSTYNEVVKGNGCYTVFINEAFSWETFIDPESVAVDNKLNLYHLVKQE